MYEVYEYTYTRRKVAEVSTTVRAPSDVAAAIGKAAGLCDAEQESLLVLSLDTRNHVIGMTEVYKGNVSASLVRVGELFRDAVRLNAAGVILVHNHPSGDPTPSPDDMHLTAEALAAGKLLDIHLLDHIIVGQPGGWGPWYTSLRDQGVAFDRPNGGRT